MPQKKKKKRYKPKPLLHIRFLILIFALLFIFIMMYKNVHIIKGQIVDDPSITGYERNGILIQKEYNQYCDSSLKLEEDYPYLHYGDTVWIICEESTQEVAPKDINILFMIKE